MTRSGWHRAVVVALIVAAGAAIAAEPGTHTRRSGFAFMTPSTQAMQRDDTQNPGMLWVGDGEASWQRKVGKANQACSDCHAAASTSMRGVATRYPDFDSRTLRPVNLAQRINLCRERHQKAEPMRLESRELLSLEAFVAFQSRDMPIAPATDERLASFREHGKQLYLQRMGQLDLACTQCHDQSAGKRLGGSVIPQAHPTGYPLYRLEWQSLGSLQRRLRGCLTGIRAEPFAYGAPELVELELFLASRAAGLPLETPAVRP